MLKIMMKWVVCFLLVCGLLTGCGASNEKAYLQILQKEKNTVQRYAKKGYIAYLTDVQKKLPQKIAEKNRYVSAINTTYLQMERQQKTEYIETWQPSFTEAWKGFEQAFLELKASFQPQNDFEKSEAQRLELQWQVVMQEHTVVSLEAPLFFVAGD